MNPITKPIKICFVAPKAYPLFRPENKTVFGGAEVDLYYLATELAKDQNYNVTFITADYGQPHIETIENVTVIKSLDLNKNALIGFWHIWRALRKADAQIYFQEVASMGTFLVALYCKLYRKCFCYRTASIAECNGLYFQQQPLTGKFVKWAFKCADHLIVQNDSDQTNMKATLGISSLVIRNAQRISAIEQEKQKFILWVGRSMKIKAPERFIELARKFPQEKFVMICQRATGDNRYDQLLHHASQTANLEFHQQVPFHKIDRFFLQAAISVNTSDSEGFPNTFIHSGDGATAILSFNVNPDNFLDRYACGIYCHADMQKMKEGLKFMLDHNRYEQMGRNARKYVEENHDITKIIEQYKMIFVTFTDR